jgi:type IV pilus assembly protein PilE
MGSQEGELPMRSNIRGFTLVELMVVIVIVAILAAVAIPGYRAHVLRAQRTDATGALLRISAAQERFFLQNNTYSATLGPLNITTPTDGGTYNLTLVAAGNTYTATATAIGSQADDTKCTSFTVNQNGVRTSAPNPVAECWR